MTHSEFVKYITKLVLDYRKTATKEPDFFDSVTIAQAIHETGYGTSELYTDYNNAFGYKAKVVNGVPEWDGKVADNYKSDEEVDGEVYKDVESDFRWYDSVEESVADHANMMTRLNGRYLSTYRKAIDAKTPKGQAHALTSTYAGDSKYAKKVIEVMDEWNLYQYDTEPTKKENIIMGTHLIIAGHGRNPNNGYFDPGATGHIAMGEHKYMRDVLFPLMKKYVPDGVKTVFFSDYNVYSKGNLVSLANSYGKDTIVTEMHFDATGNNTASGGHIIIHKNFKADKIDLALRDAVKDMMGLAYPIHMGDKGISGRSDLANPNRAANGGVNYRLPELGFGTNPRDANIMLNQADKYARALCKALFGKVKEENKEQPVELDDAHIVVHGEYLWLIAEKYGITVQNLKDWNKLTSNIIYTGQVLKVKEPEKVIEEGQPDPEISTPVEEQPVDDGEGTEAIELEPWHFYDGETGKVYKISETEMVYEK